VDDRAREQISANIPAQSNSASAAPESATGILVSQDTIELPTISFAKRISASAETRFVSTFARQICDS
jgi:hypothetical protein